MSSHRPRIALIIHVFTTLSSTNLTARRSNACTEILRAPEKDIVLSKKANISEEIALFPEHNGENPIFLACLIPLLG